MRYGLLTFTFLTMNVPDHLSPLEVDALTVHVCSPGPWRTTFVANLDQALYEGPERLIHQCRSQVHVKAQKTVSSAPRPIALSWMYT